jgi:hypothetical protein
VFFYLARQVEKHWNVCCNAVGGCGLIKLAQAMDKLRAVEITAADVCVSYRVGSFVTCWDTVSASRTSLHLACLLDIAFYAYRLLMSELVWTFGSVLYNCKANLAVVPVAIKDRRWLNGGMKQKAWLWCMLVMLQTVSSSLRCLATGCSLYRSRSFACLVLLCFVTKMALTAGPLWSRVLTGCAVTKVFTCGNVMCRD